MGHLLPQRICSPNTNCMADSILRVIESRCKPSELFLGKSNSQGGSSWTSYLLAIWQRLCRSRTHNRCVISRMHTLAIAPRARLFDLVYQMQRVLTIKKKDFYTKHDIFKEL